MLAFTVKGNLFAAVAAVFVAGCDAPSKPSSGPPQTDAEFNRMVSAGKMLSDLQNYLASLDRAPQTFTFDRLSFDPGSALIRPVDQPTIHTLAATLQNYPAARARIIGFSDGDRDGVTRSLGLQRARAIMLAVQAAGVPASRLEAAGGRDANGPRTAQLTILKK